MKKTLKEELERIHQLTYGTVINEQEGFLNTIQKKIDSFIGKRDDPKKADYVSPDVEEFFNTLNSSVKNGGLTQQRKGSMTYQKEVESMQIGLVLLGYELPRYGVDGLFGPETASAVNKFTTDNLTNNVNESSMIQLNTINYSNVKTDDDETKYDTVNKELLDDIQTAASNSNVNVKITTAKTGHNKYAKGSNRVSRHMTGAAVDISIINDKPVISNREDTNKFVGELVKLGYVKNKESGNPKAVLTYGFPGHDNHVHISNNVGISGTADSVEPKKDIKLTQATPEMLQKLIDLLQDRGIKPEELKKYTDKTINISDIKDTNYYVKLLEELGAPTSEENLKFLLAWRQAEGKAGKYNPFNTTQKMAGATNYNDVGVKNYLTLEDGFVATIKTLKNGKYNCILDGLRNDIGADRIAQCKSLETWGTGDLVTKVLSSYKKGSNPKDIPLA